MAISGKHLALAAAAVLAAGLALSAGSAEAQVTYGEWRVTNDCRPARTQSGVGGTQLPRASAGVTQECYWVRSVRDCPRIRDRLMHPIQCSTRSQRSPRRSILPPSN